MKNKNLGVILKVLRALHFYSLTQASELSGISRIYIDMLETGYKKCPTNKTLNKLCSAYHISTEQLMMLLHYYESLPENEIRLFKLQNLSNQMIIANLMKKGDSTVNKQ